MKKIYGSYTHDLVPNIDRILTETELKYPGKKLQVNIHIDKNMVLHAEIGQRREMRIYIQVRNHHDADFHLTQKDVVDEHHAQQLLKELLQEIEQQYHFDSLEYGLQEHINGNWQEWEDKSGLTIRAYL